MKSLVLTVVLVIASLNIASANSGAKSNQPKEDGIKIVREWK